MGKLIDLTGATVTVPPNWTASEGYGTFKVNGLFNAYEFTDINIGYNPIRGENVVNQFWLGAQQFSPTNSFEFSVTGGIDANNPLLKQWFLDNNATIEGGVWEDEAPKLIIKYKDKIIYTGDSTKECVVRCKDKKFTDDLYISTEVQSGAKLNIHYGMQPPTDTSKLWIKLANAPSKVEIANKLNGGNETLDSGIASLPSSLRDMGCASVGTKIYLFGGLNGTNYLNTINAFDIETNTITTLSPKLPSGVQGISSASVGTKIYLFGGHKSTGFLNTINVFDTETNTITTLSTKLPIACNRMGCASVGTKIYLFGGYGDSMLSTINVFDTETNTITTLSTKLPSACSGMGCASIGTKIYLFGGSGTIILDTINAFDIETNTITTLSTKLPSVCSYMGCASIGTKIYLFGGYGDSMLSTINRFNTQYDVENNTLVLLNQNTPNKLPIINDEHLKIEIGVGMALLGNSSNVGEEVEYSIYDGTEWK